jgi:hypothetical protein
MTLQASKTWSSVFRADPQLDQAVSWPLMVLAPTRSPGSQRSVPVRPSLLLFTPPRPSGDPAAPTVVGQGAGSSSPPASRWDRRVT